MNRSGTMGIGSSLLLGFGVLASTILSALFSHSAWLVLLGPVSMAAVMIGTSALGPLPDVARRKAVSMSVILGAALILASVIVVVGEPEMLALVLPVLAGSTAGVLVTTPLFKVSPEQSGRDCHPRRPL